MELIKAEETAARLGVTIGTLAVWRCQRRYPLKYVKIGRNVRYRVEDVDDFIRARTMSGVSELRVGSRSARRARA
jgi:hypothetical protein